MKKTFTVLAVMTAIFGGCEALNNYPPPVTPAMAKESKRSGATMEQLEHGRKLYAGRCLECHVLPAIAHYPAEKWPGIVHWMGERAELKQAEQEAIISYVLAAHPQRRNSSGK
jgi:hypothetical protein